MHMGGKKFFFPLALALMTVLSGCQDRAPISKKDMASLFAGFYTTDARIDVLREENALPFGGLDSLRVYQPLLDSLGYTNVQFREAMNFYLYHPEDMEDIFDRVHAILQKEYETAELAARQEAPEKKVIDAPAEPEKFERLENPDKPLKKEKPEKPETERGGRKRMSKKDLKKLEEELK